MRGTCKKLITDINRGAELETKLPEYVRIMNCQYNLYATVKMCMNYYTMKEMVQERDDNSSDYCRYFDVITALIKRHIIDREAVSEESVSQIKDIRQKIESRMKILTSYTDGYEVYEYILNRVEAGIMGTVDDIDTDHLAAKLFNYVFMENDTVMINSKLQLIMSQLPVRMTKMKFFDIVARTLSIYTGSEKTSADEFADMLKSAALLDKPEGFETEYPFLYEVYKRLTEMDAGSMDKEEFISINDSLSVATNIIANDVSVYMLLQEIVNDVYTLLLTVDTAFDANRGAIGFNSAITILKECVEEDLDELPETLMARFVDIEGVQETVYENIMLLEAAYDDIASGKAEMIDSLGLRASFDNLSVIEKLLSTSLFIDVEKKQDSDTGLADSDYINKLKEELIGELTVLFKGVSKTVTRSIMCKLLSTMPVFMNNKQEIQDYFNYVLNNCNDASELTACSKLLNEIMEED